MNIEHTIRNLAKSSYYQNLYCLSKDIFGISVFQNTNNYSGLQVLFLYWLRTYDFLYELINKKEYPFLDKQLIDDSIRVDAFLYFHKKRKERELHELKKENKPSKHRFKKDGKQTTFDVDFGSK